MNSQFKNCENCGNVFIPANLRQRFCNPDCRHENYYELNKDKFKQRSIEHYNNNKELRKEWQEENKEKIREYQKEYQKTRKWKDYVNEYWKEYAKRPNTRAKILARHYAQNALRRGELKREACSFCGQEQAEMHHNDYNQPLLIVWLCP
ncbi:hypothetical protein LCGC14_2932860, partial [marine sediment metagenome]